MLPMPSTDLDMNAAYIAAMERHSVANNTMYADIRIYANVGFSSIAEINDLVEDVILDVLGNFNDVDTVGYVPNTDLIDFGMYYKYSTHSFDINNASPVSQTVTRTKTDIVINNQSVGYVETYNGSIPIGVSGFQIRCWLFSTSVLF